MRIEFKLLGVLALVGGLGACTPGADSPSATSPAPVSSSPGAATLSVNPGSVSGCDQASWVTSMVSWRVKDDAAARVKVVVVSPGAEGSNLFAEGGAEGGAKTENWVQSGTRFTLINADTGADLASYTVDGPDCGAPQ